VGDKRKPGVRTGSDSSIEIDFYYRNKRCRERIGLKPTPRNINYAAKLKARIEHEIATGEFDYRKHFRTRREQSSSRNYRVMPYDRDLPSVMVAERAREHQAFNIDRVREDPEIQFSAGVRKTLPYRVAP
jgi:Arm DNA-binding domain